MKKFTALFLVVSLTFALAACGNSGRDNADGSSTDSYEASSIEETSGVSQGPQENGEAAEATETPDSVSEEQSKILVAYFSWADNAVLAEDVDAVSSPSVIPSGNVQQLAGWVQEETGADVFSIHVTDPYPSDWDECLERANQERGDNARPELVENIEDLSQYDTIFLGYPNWWYGVPMALLTFLESNDFSGKQVFLFCSHGTGGLANSVEIISEAIPDAEISDNIFDCYEEEASSSEESIRQWVQELGYSGGQTETAAQSGGEVQENTLSLQIGDTALTATMEDNSSVQALMEMLAEGPLEIAMQDYGDMEKVGSLGQELPTNDEEITTEAGDLILYQGNSLVIYYAPNSWNFTRLGKINDVSEEELREILGDGDVSVTLSLVE
ncbi:MAG: hypothetical protein KHZ73_07010 [Lachnospiraceae bacterium]|nr:hypothetical protein [Lachnospiraceae bacterium]